MAGKGAQIEAVERLVHESVGKVDAIAPDQLRSLLPALRQARDELRADLSRWLQDAPNASERFTAYQRTQALRALEATFKRIDEVHHSMRDALGKGREETGALAVKNLEHEVQRLSAIFGGGAVHIPQLDTAAIIAKGDRLLWKRHATSAQRYAAGIGEDIKHRFAVSLAKGDTFEQMVQRLRGSPEMKAVISASDPGAAAFGVSDAMFHRWRHWADRLVRTENMHAYNVQHDLSIEHVNENRSEDDEEYLRRWDASADVVTCPLCKELDRTLATIKGDFKGGIHSPPRHPYCRCVVLAWLARWGNFKGEVPAKDSETGQDIAPKPDLPPKRKPEPEPEPERKPDEKQSKPKRERKPKGDSGPLPEIVESVGKYGSHEFAMDTGIQMPRGMLRLEATVSKSKGSTLVDGKIIERDVWRVTTTRHLNGKKFGAITPIATFEHDQLEQAKAEARKALERAYRAAQKRAGAAKEAPADKPAKGTAAPPKPKTQADHRAAADAALVKGDYHDARQQIDDALRSRGFFAHAMTTKQAKTEVQPILAGGRAAGLHHLQSGTIQIDKAHADKAQRFATEWEKDPKGARAAIEDFQRQREAYFDGKGPAPDTTARGAQLWREAYGQHVLTHESLHGFGATLADEYFGTNADIEEITTEVMARRMTRERYGIDYHAIAKGKEIKGTFAAYEDRIQKAIAGIRDATGVPHSTALKLLEDASEDYKKQPADSSRFPHERIAEFIAKRTRPKLMKDDIYSAAHELHAPAKYAQRRDGSTPSIHEMRIERALWNNLNGLAVKGKKKK